ncbi:hypothetical protein [Rahnella sp. PCH160]|uniref:hypothetical protein n=1 Tax=Rahnella sp. PCH160 TaxID=3447928 RepID=UPI0039FD644B
MDLKKLTVTELIQINQHTLDELERRSILKIRSNPITEYTFWLVKNKMNMALKPSFGEGYDFKTSDGRKIQVMAKRNQLKNNATMIGVISERELRQIDDFLIVIFNGDMSIDLALMIQNKAIMKFGVYNKFHKGYTLRINTALINDESVRDIKLVLCDKSSCNVYIERFKSESIVRDLKIVGKRTFVEYYQYFLDEVDVNYIIEIMLIENINWKQVTARTKANKMKSIFKNNDCCEVLRVIIDSINPLVTQSTKQKAKVLLEKTTELNEIN